MLGHGDRPKDEGLDRIATTNQARVADGEELAPLIAGFQALVARRTVPERRTVLDAVQEVDHVGPGAQRAGRRGPGTGEGPSSSLPPGRAGGTATGPWARTSLCGPRRCVPRPVVA